MKKPNRAGAPVIELTAEMLSAGRCVLERFWAEDVAWDQVAWRVFQAMVQAQEHARIKVADRTEYRGILDTSSHRPRL